MFIRNGRHIVHTVRACYIVSMFWPIARTPYMHQQIWFLTKHVKKVDKRELHGLNQQKCRIVHGYNYIGHDCFWTLHHRTLATEYIHLAWIRELFPNIFNNN